MKFCLDFHCERHGVKVVNCWGFRLTPGQEHELLISYQHETVLAEPEYNLRMRTKNPETNIDFTVKVDYPKQGFWSKIDLP